MAEHMLFSDKEPTTTEEKAQKYSEIVDGLLGIARGGNPLHSIVVSSIIRKMRIHGPNGESPDGA